MTGTSSSLGGRRVRRGRPRPTLSRGTCGARPHTTSLETQGLPARPRSMARRTRGDAPGSWHHVVNRGLAKRPLFEDRIDVRFFLSRLAREVRRGRIEIHAWCVLTTHFHLLVRSPIGELSEAMRRAENEHSRAFNRRHRRDGTLVRGRFLSKRVDSLTYRRTLVRYIDHNPVRAGLASHPGSYPWGSARQYTRGPRPNWLECSWVEAEVAGTGASDFSTGYLAHFGRVARGAVGVIDERTRRPRREASDDLDHLVHGAPSRIRSWMEKKARLADGTRPGLPVCDVRSVLRVIERNRSATGDWIVSPVGRTTNGWAVARAGMLKDLAGMSWVKMARVIESPEATCRLFHTWHGRLLIENEDYARRLAALGAAALRACFPRTR